MFSIGVVSLPHYELTLHFCKSKKFDCMQFICNKNSGTMFCILKIFWLLRESNSATTFELTTYWWQKNKHTSHLFIIMELLYVLAELTLRRVSLGAPNHKLTSKKCKCKCLGLRQHLAFSLCCMYFCWGASFWLLQGSQNYVQPLNPAKDTGVEHGLCWWGIPGHGLCPTLGLCRMHIVCT